MKLTFTKMQGAGNDFVVIDGVTQSVALSTAQLRWLADRRRGVGCDQILLVTPPDDPDAAFRYHVFNADGSRAGQCGNGARCVGRFLREKRLTRQQELLLLQMATLWPCHSRATAAFLQAWLLLNLPLPTYRLLRSQ